METVAFAVVVAGLLGLGVYVLMSFAKDDDDTQHDSN